MTIDAYRALWESHDDRYVLLRVPSGHAIFDVQARGTVIIEDDDLYREVKQRMLDNGAAVVDRPPTP
ncbi:hypothetical protein GCM10009827_108090 [Dactylosporangium maewongense]|uniref:Uncharacterized protein n=1 Tax=Dactylosporangium maewongense TaxID=634393 RepID=A0ABN2D2H3_9ACTN